MKKGITEPVQHLPTGKNGRSTRTKRRWAVAGLLSLNLALVAAIMSGAARQPQAREQKQHRSRP